MTNLYHFNYLLTQFLPLFFYIFIYLLIYFDVGDVELESDVKYLHDILVKNYKELSTYDKWVSEVKSGMLCVRLCFCVDLGGGG